MANYQLGPVIGKIGGGVEVQKIPVNIVADGDTGSTEGISVTVPEGEIWLIVLQGDPFPSSAIRGSAPQMVIGERVSPSVMYEEYTAFSAEVAGPSNVPVGLRRNRWQGDDRIVGHVYTVPMPD